MTLYQSWKDVPKATWRWKNFSPRELACKGTGSIRVDEVALDKLQELRDKLGIPLLITSAYRSPEHNKKVGGAKNSYHMRGVAFDIRMENQDPHGFELAAREVGFRGIGYYPKQGFMHIDLGPERTWGTPFKRSATGLRPEPEVREKLVESKTVQAAVAQAASGAVAAGSALGALSGTAQVVLLVFAGITILTGVFILRERIKAWAEGWR
jgi:zinc D-Ala-D-Ala carboxypeptidase